MSETVCQPPSPSDVLPQPLSPAAQATLDLLLSGPKSSSRPSPVSRLASGPVPQPACWRVLRVCDWPQAQPSQLATHSGPSVYDPSSNPPKHSSAQPARTTSSLVRLPGSQQPTHGFAASWLRLASGPAQSLPSPGPSASQGTPATTGPQLPAHQQAQRPTTSLTCLRLVSSYASCSAAQADQAFSAQSETGLKVCQPETSLRPSPSARLLACLTCRLASGPA